MSEVGLQYACSQIAFADIQLGGSDTGVLDVRVAYTRYRVGCLIDVSDEISREHVLR